MKKIYILLCSFCGVFGFCQNSININGSTNINSFKCVNSKFVSEGGLVFTENHLPSMTLKVKDFSCGNVIMTKDFQKTLKAETYPNLHIKFISFSKKENNRYSAVVEVKMMDKTVKYYIDFTIMNNRITGSRTVKFSDFDIVPPRRMGGVIKVKDELNLIFNMSVKN